MYKIKDNIYNVGVDMLNSFLLTGDKNVLIDTVHRSMEKDFISNIEKIIPVSEIDYIVCNHTEPNRSDGIMALLRINPNIEVIASIAGIHNLKEMLNTPFNERVAKDGAVFDIGKGMSLKFLITPNLNWPDTMVTYEEESGILFSGDMFSSSGGEGGYIEKLYDYYSSYLKPYTGFILTALDRISELRISAIYPGEGIMIDKMFMQAAVASYREWSKPVKNAKCAIAVVYFSYYGATAEMAQTIYDAAAAENADVMDIDVSLDDVFETLEFIERADAVVFGTPTLDRGAGEELLHFIASLGASRLRSKAYFVFGSHGWSGEGVQIVHELLKQMRMRPFSKPFTSIFNMSEKRREELKEHTRGLVRFISDLK